MNAPISLFRRCCAELPGTSWLVFGGCGSAVLAAAFPGPGIGFLGVALAFGLTVLGATDAREPQGFAPIAIGLGLTLVHPIGIPVTNLSVNPARSTGPALFAGGWAVEQLWLFWVAPIVAVVLAGLVCPAMARGSGPDETRAAETSR